MNAAEVKDALRRRHPAVTDGTFVGEWTCLEEWLDIDLLAISAWGGAKNIGYEVKVSRADYRREVLRPDKRVRAVAGCHEFYFAVPEGLLKPAEIAYVEPEWDGVDFRREPCPGVPQFGEVQFYRGGRRSAGRDSEPVHRYGGPCSDWNTRRVRGSTIKVPAMATAHPEWDDEYVPCPTCAGKGYLQRSRVEREAPTLWVPADVGLIEVTARGCVVRRRAPRRDPEKPLVPRSMTQLVRWASARPDPRHAAISKVRPA